MNIQHSGEVEEQRASARNFESDGYFESQNLPEQELFNLKL